MTLEYRCSKCGAELHTTNVDPLNQQMDALVKALTEIATRDEEFGFDAGAVAREVLARLNAPVGDVREQS